MRKLKNQKQMKKAILEAKKQNASIVTCIDGYITDEECLLLGDFLWACRDAGVDVIFVPKEK